MINDSYVLMNLQFSNVEYEHLSCEIASIFLVKEYYKRITNPNGLQDGDCKSEWTAGRRLQIRMDGANPNGRRKSEWTAEAE